MCVHAASPVPEVGAFDQASALQGLPVCESEVVCDEKLCGAVQLSEVRTTGNRTRLCTQPGAAGAGAGALPGGSDTARGGGQLEIR